MAEPAAGFDIRRILLLAGVIAVIAFAALFFFFRGCVPAARGPSGYTVIYSNLALKDAANVIARLKELGIPYEIRDEGKAIAVPKDKSDDARLGLAEENLPAGGVVGWEIFDEARLGATDFDRRIQLIRAISGELSRTIRRIEAVEDARVQIVLPETRLFAAEVAPVTASVMLRLRPGAELTPGKVNGIVHLVASSVENLRPENVTVVDDTGKILTVKGVTLPEEKIITRAEAVPMEEIEITPEVAALAPEATAEVTITATQPALTPEEKIMFRVQAKKKLEMDLGGKAQEILNRFYPPNSVIVKINIELENSEPEQELKDESLKVNNLSAIILVDNRVDISPELKQSTFKAVAAAIGYNRDRGDRIILQKVPFHLATPPPEVVRAEVEKLFPPKPEREKLGFLAALPRDILWIGGVLGAALILLIIFRRVRRKPEAVEGAEKIGMPARERRVGAEEISTLDRVRSMSERNPERIAELLKSWLTK